jgi:hypothetical protein
MPTERRIRPAAIVLVAIGVVLVIVGIIYLTQTADNLPSFMGKPDRQDLQECTAQLKAEKTPCYVSRHYTKRGIAALGLAGVAFVAAWYVSGLRPTRSHAQE